MAMSSDSAVISDCDGVPGEQSRCTLCKQPLRGKHSHPGQWKSELQQFLLKYSVIPGAHVSARPVSVASDGDCMANTKVNLFPVGLSSLGPRTHICVKCGTITQLHSLTCV